MRCIQVNLVSFITLAKLFVYIETYRPSPNWESSWLLTRTTVTGRPVANLTLSECRRVMARGYRRPHRGTLAHPLTDAPCIRRYRSNSFVAVPLCRALPPVRRPVGLSLPKLTGRPVSVASRPLHSRLGQNSSWRPTPASRTTTDHMPLPSIVAWAAGTPGSNYKTPHVPNSSTPTLSPACHSLVVNYTYHTCRRHILLSLILRYL
jgi:hypothetical protein